MEKKKYEIADLTLNISLDIGSGTRKRSEEKTTNSGS